VVRAEIRKAAAARKTDLPADRLPGLKTGIRPAEKGLLWGLMHDAANVLPSLRRLEPEDLEGLSAAGVLRAAQGLEETTSDTPSALMERLTKEEAQMLAAAAAEPSPPVLSPERSVESLKRLRLERERADVQREIDRLQSAGDFGPNLDALLTRKSTLVRLLESDKDGETGYNRRLG
jgi:hypothetical protein